MRFLRHTLGLGRPTVISIGNFDGCHLGHRAVVHALKSKSDELSLPAMVVSFEPMPQRFFRQPGFTRLMPFREKFKTFAAWGVDAYQCIRFNKQVANLSPEAFVERFIQGVSAQHVVVGHDFHFGQNRSGDVRVLTELCEPLQIGVSVLPPYTLAGERVSSTLVRKALQAGQLEDVTRYLGHPFHWTGHVERGHQRGRTIGFPTANIAISQPAPLHGVFAVTCTVGETTYPAIANVGRRPTFGRLDRVWLEVHILDQTLDLYGQRVRVTFEHAIRQEKAFDSVEALRQQIERDCDDARAWFRVQTSQ